MAGFVSCSVYRYSTVRIERRIPFPCENKKDVYDKGDNVSRERKDKSKKRLKVYKKREFARIISFSPVAKINNRGVVKALAGKFREAEILFLESARDEKNPAVLNNLGIIYELFMDRKKAFTFYSQACIIDPDNDSFRANLLLFLESNGRGRRQQIDPEKKNKDDRKRKTGYIKERETPDTPIEMKKIKKEEGSPDEKATEKLIKTKKEKENGKK